MARLIELETAEHERDILRSERAAQCVLEARRREKARTKPMDEGELWSWVRSVMSQGGTIHLDHQHKTYEQYSARLDAAAAERAKELWARMNPPNRLLAGCVRRERM
jgi:hypothetical protein